MDTITDLADAADTIIAALNEAGFRDVSVVDGDLTYQTIGAVSQNGTPISIGVNVTT